MIVYKYLSPNRIHVLENALIRFTQASALNDPFEYAPRLDKLRNSWDQRAAALIENESKEYDYVVMTSLQLEGRRIVTKKLAQLVNEMRNDIGVLSLSENWDSLLMWSHYCDSHQGFIIGFDRNDDFFAVAPNKRTALNKVTYSKLRPELPNWSEIKSENRLEIMQSILFTKSPEWSYEQELRVIAKLALSDETLNVTGGVIHLFRYPIETVKEIILGCAIDKIKARQIIAICKDLYPTARLFQAKMSNIEFSLDRKEIK